MRRLALGAAASVLLVVAVLFPSWLYTSGGSAEQVDEPTSITSYDAVFRVGDNGSMRVVETIVVNVSTFGRHGIFRFFDRADPNAPELRRQPRDISVQQDGGPATVDYSYQDQGRFYVAKVGDPDRTLALGEHTYRIEYVVDDVLIDDPDGAGSRFYWQLIPAGWAQEITQARLSVQLPAEAGNLRCAVGATATAGCDATGEGTSIVGVALGDLEAFTPVTVQTEIDLPVPPRLGDTYAWPPRFDPVLAPWPALVLIVLAGLLAAAIGAWASRRAHEPPPGFPLQYAPPPGIGPAQAAYILEERVGREQFVATVLHAAEQGVVTLERQSPRAWSLRLAGEKTWQDVDPVTAGLSTLIDTGERRFTASPTDSSAGKRLKEQLDSFEPRTKSWALKQKLMVTGPIGGAGGVLVIVMYVAALGYAVWNPFGVSLLAIVPGMFAIGGLGLLAPGSATLRTAAGRDLWSRVGGFRRVLSTPASKQRFDFSGREELYTAYVPWAVAFGCADAWAAKYRTETGGEPPVPAYLGAGYVGAHTSSHVDQMIGDFDSTVSAAISSYQATQSSSSSGGGGGFSGGGGGGGGGGGSW
ncbi:MAG: DUF2207 domain-containing protein [Nocardioides sp.]